MAHQAAIEYGGETIGVLGHGFSHMYPKKNQKIAEEMAENHLFVTEYPPYYSASKMDISYAQSNYQWFV